MLAENIIIQRRLKFSWMTLAKIVPTKVDRKNPSWHHLKNNINRRLLKNIIN